MNLSARYRTRTLDVIIYPGFKAIEAVATVHIFDDANARLVAAGFPPVYDMKLVAPQPGAVASDTLVSLNVEKRLSALALPDTAIIVGARDIQSAIARTPELVEWCRAAAPRLVRTVGLCSGSFFLAEAQLLDGKRATTHWTVTSLMARRYPAVRVEEDSIYVKDGAVWTSAGASAGMDLALAMIEEDLGRDIALSVARDLVIYLKRSGGQSQFSIHLSSQMTDHPIVRRIQEWVLSGLDREFSIADLAKRAAMSERNFSRVFARETGHGPAEFIEIARVEMARRLLEDRELPIKTIALRSGFRSDDHMRRAFQRRCGVAPKEYQERFARTGANEMHCTLEHEIS